ncbi:hypothetical protein ScPMuIL_017370 [Solemya velum]
MFRIAQRVGSTVQCVVRNNIQKSSAAVFVRHSHGKQESDEDFDNRYEAYFNRPDIDGWELRKAMNDLQGMDMVPEPRIIIAALKACRKLNDFALAVRYLEAVQEKCGSRKNEIWPYLEQEIRPTLDSLGILTPEEMGYGKPELAIQDVYSM